MADLSQLALSLFSTQVHACLCVGGCGHAEPLDKDGVWAWFSHSQLDAYGPIAHVAVGDQRDPHLRGNLGFTHRQFIGKSGALLRRQTDYSMVMRLLLIRLENFTVSSRINLRKVSGAIGLGVKPCAAMRPLTADESRMATTSWFK